MDCPTSWIVSRPDLLGGKPCVRGTRLAVELLQELLADGATRQEILAAYQSLPAEGLEAALQWQPVRSMEAWSKLHQMPATLITDPPPLHEDPLGTIRVGGTRVTLDTVVYAYEGGDAPEEIVESFPALTLAQVFGALAYYHQHR